MQSQQRDLSRNSSQIVFLAAGWYFFSITLSLYNKWMFDAKSKIHLPYPILITSFHQFMLYLISCVYIKLTHRNSPIQPHQPSTLKEKVVFYLKYIIPTALASAGDIGAGNTSFKYITLTVYTVVKSSSIAFVLIFGILFKLESFNWNLFAIVIVMFFGVVLMVYRDSATSEAEPDFLLGFILVLVSATLSGLRWVITQLVLRRNSASPKKKDPVYTIKQLAPPMGVVLMLTAFIVERPWDFFQLNFWNQLDSEPLSITYGVFLLGLPGVLVFFMTICEFGILQRAQVLTLSIAGVVKELLTIMVSMVVLGDRLHFYNWCGVIVIIGDVICYNIFRYRENLHKNADPGYEMVDHDTIFDIDDDQI